MRSAFDKGLSRAGWIVLAMPVVLTSCASSVATDPSRDLRPRRAIIDADTGNEIDDLYAIVRVLVEPRFEVVGLSSAQYHTQRKAPPNTVEYSQKLNEEILRLMGKQEIPHPMGSNEPLPDQATPRDSPAARHIIDEVRKLPDGEQLVVFVTGPMTNVASAILLDPSIISKLDLWVICMGYDDEAGKWNKDEFNSNNDRQAVALLLNTEGLELHVMTATASRALVFQKDVTEQRLTGQGGVWDYLVDRWDAYNAVKTWSSKDSNERRWIMWDITLIEAFLHPGMARAALVRTPPENTPRRVRVFTRIDADAMEEDYWRALEAYRERG